MYIMDSQIPIYLINLHNRPERLINSLKELRKINLSKNITRIEACTPEDAYKNQHLYLTLSAYNNIKDNNSTTILPNYKALACAISHINTWKLIKNSRFNYAIIIEDDIEINDPELCKIQLNRTNSVIQNIMSDDNNNKDIKKPIFITFNSLIENDNIVLSNDTYKYKSLPMNKKSVPYNINTNYVEDNTTPLLKKINGRFTGLHFYFIDLNMINFLLQKISTDRITYQIDIQIYEYIKMWDSINSYTYNLQTSTILQSKKYISDIQWFNYTPVNLAIVLKIPLDISEHICKYICNFTKKQTENLFNNIYFNNGHHI